MFAVHAPYIYAIIDRFGCSLWSLIVILLLIFLQNASERRSDSSSGSDSSMEVTSDQVCCCSPVASVRMLTRMPSPVRFGRFISWFFRIRKEGVVEAVEAVRLEKLEVEVELTRMAMILTRCVAHLSHALIIPIITPSHALAVHIIPSSLWSLINCQLASVLPGRLSPCLHLQLWVLDFPSYFPSGRSERERKNWAGVFAVHAMPCSHGYPVRFRCSPWSLIPSYYPSYFPSGRTRGHEVTEVTRSQRSR